MQQCAEENIYRKITITRANVEFDREIGALPGDEINKVGPLLRGCMDNLELLVDAKSVKSREGREEDIRSKVEYLFDRGYLSACCQMWRRILFFIGRKCRRRRSLQRQR